MIAFFPEHISCAACSVTIIIIIIIISSRCCDNKCLLELTGQMILTAQQKIHYLSRNERRLWIQDKISENSHMVNDKLEISYYVGGRKVCRAGFQLIY